LGRPTGLGLVHAENADGVGVWVTADHLAPGRPNGREHGRPDVPARSGEHDSHWQRSDLSRSPRKAVSVPCSADSAARRTRAWTMVMSRTVALLQL